MTNFKQLNESLPALRVLEALGLQEWSHTPEEWRGRCPFHSSGRPRSRSFAVSLVERKFFCHRCKRCGDLLDLWAGVREVSLRDAAQQLQDRFS